MNRDLDFSPSVYGLGAGVYFLTYAIFEVPSNYMLTRLGARRWLARIMISWGLVSALMAFVYDEKSFLFLRILLGAAEAGFVPGVILYLTHWLPRADRASAIALFLLAIPVSNIIGAPISGLVMSGADDFLGFKGWQWLFVIESAPSIILGACVYFFLDDRPENSNWLSSVEKHWLQMQLQLERNDLTHDGKRTIKDAILNYEKLIHAIIYFGVVLASYGLIFWLPQIISGFGVGALEVGFLTALPYACGGIAMVIWSHRVDKFGSARQNACVASVLFAAGLILSSLADAPPMMLLSLSMCAAGSFSMAPIFWNHVTSQLHAVRLPASIALINSIASLSGLFGPSIVGLLRESFGDYKYALGALAVGPLTSAALLYSDGVCGKAAK